MNELGQQAKEHYIFNPFDEPHHVCGSFTDQLKEFMWIHMDQILFISLFFYLKNFNSFALKEYFDEKNYTPLLATS